MSAYEFIRDLLWRISKGEIDGNAELICASTNMDKKQAFAVDRISFAPESKQGAIILKEIPVILRE